MSENPSRCWLYGRRSEFILMCENNGQPIIFMPNGKPVPEIMIESELIEFLRLKELGIANPKQSIRYYRERGKLKATRIGNHNTYTRISACEFLKSLTPKNREGRA